MAGGGYSQVTTVAAHMHTNCIYEAFQETWQQKGEVSEGSWSGGRGGRCGEGAQARPPVFTGPRP